MKDKITLIIPPSIFLIDERVFVSLGILKVAAALETENYQIDLLDLSGIDNYLEVLEDYFTTSDSKIAGITATSPQMTAVKKICNVIPNDVKTILGGPHATMTVASKKREDKLGTTGRAQQPYEELLHLVDTVVAGDGEEAIFAVLQQNFPKLVDADDPKSDMFLKGEQLNVLPARHLIDINSYKYEIEGKKATSLISQLGCPYGCAFCGGRFSPSFRRARIRDTQSVLDEVRHLYEEYGFEAFMFYDDELNVNKKFEELLTGLAALQNELEVFFNFRGFLKSNLITELQADLMKKAGFTQILVGFEAGDDRILTNIQKKASLKQNTECMRILHKYKLKVKALMSIGHPGESPQTIDNLKNWLLETQPDDFDLTIISTYPGTPYYDDAKRIKGGLWVYTTKSGDHLYSESLDFTKDSNYYKGIPDTGYKSYVSTDFITADELVIARDKVEHEVREKLNIPFYTSHAIDKYEHSMGQIPTHILRNNYAN